MLNVWANRSQATTLPSLPDTASASSGSSDNASAPRNTTSCRCPTSAARMRPSRCRSTIIQRISATQNRSIARRSIGPTPTEPR